MKNLKPVRLKNFRSQFAAILLCGLYTLPANGDVIVENFSTLSKKESSTAVWNAELGIVHPTLLIKDYQVSAGPISTANIDVGDGSHGPFEPATYANFGSVVNNTITIDANIFPILKLTRFQLDAGYTLTSINGPLIIYSLSSVNINGSILCRGVNGAPAIGASGGAGGSGRCGGFNGGTGGNANQAGASGSTPANLSGAGGGGAPVGGRGGGGAGSYNTNAGVTGANGGGAGGLGAANDDFSNLNASPGGGGGSGSASEGGGGGGGGGGTVIIHAVGNINLSPTAILAQGGSGGAANTSGTEGGGGGGGGGGSVKIFTPANIDFLGTNPIDATGGSGGLAGSRNGGNASYGRTWVVFNTFTGPGIETPTSNLNQIGTLEYVTTPQVVISKSYDTQSSLAEFQSIAANPASPDISFEFAGSNDDFVSDDSGWLSLSQISSVNKKRYVKFKMILTNSSATTPTQVSDVLINFAPGLKELFQFKGGCGLISKAVPPVGGASDPNHILRVALLLFLLLFLPILTTLKLRKN